jgi:cobalt/nickel transport system permease protein
MSKMIPLAFLLLFIIGLAFLTKLPIKYFIFRTTFFIPIFAGIIALPFLFLTKGEQLLYFQLLRFKVIITEQGLEKALAFTLRVWVCVAILMLMIMTTNFNKLVKSLELLKIPRIFLLLTFMTYRYVFVTTHEFYQLLLAKEARTFKKDRNVNLKDLKSISKLLSNLLIRAFERSERVHLAMIARGFKLSNKKKRIEITIKDLMVSLSIIAIGFIALIIQEL